MKIKFFIMTLLSLLNLLLFAGGGSGFMGKSYPLPLPSCNWQSSGVITFFNMKLTHPADANSIMPYDHMYSNDNIYMFEDIFKVGFGVSGSIKVTVTGSGCVGTTSKATNCSVNNCSINTLRNISRPVNATSFSSTKVEITSETHTNYNTGENGKVIWTKTLNGNPFGLQSNGTFVGKFVPNPTLKSKAINLYIGKAFNSQYILW